jgi:hypothetical protein
MRRSISAVPAAARGKYWFCYIFAACEVMALFCFVVCSLLGCAVIQKYFCPLGLRYHAITKGHGWPPTSPEAAREIERKRYMLACSPLLAEN